ncbi:MAG: molybdopterin-dependent oxidoreductase [Dehalococcoidia bacterium]
MTTSAEIKKACCGICRFSCPIEVYVRNNEVVRVGGDRNCGDGTGFRCQRSIKASLDFHNHPSRLNYPLKRVGSRGGGKWERISWSQAMDKIAARIGEIAAKYGPEAVACMGGTGINYCAWAYIRWCNLFGTPNYFNITKGCFQEQSLIETAMYGSDTAIQQPVPGVTKCMVVFGGNPYDSAQNMLANFTRAKNKGAKLIVIDPRFTKTAQMADLWLPIRPGTDVALAYGMLNIIIEEGLYDKEFVDKWCLGFDELRRCVRQYSPQIVEEITGIPHEKIVEAARSYANPKPAQITTLWGSAHSHLGHGVVLPINVAQCSLRVITGNLDVEGGEVLHQDLEGLNYDVEMHWDNLIDHPLRTRDNVSADAFPASSVKGFALLRQTLKGAYKNGFLHDWEIASHVSPFYIWQAILEAKPYPIKALITAGSNILVTRTATRKIYQALKSENLGLYVNMDLFMTPSGMLADYLLPATDWLERPCMSFSHNGHTASEQSVHPKYERRHDYDLWKDLGQRLGQQEYWPETLEAMYDRFLEPSGLTFKEFTRKSRWEMSNKSRPTRRFKKYKEAGFATASGKVELLPSWLTRLGYEPLTPYQEPPRSPLSTPEIAKEFPLILITGGRIRMFWHSTLRQFEKLRRLHPDPIVQIHPDTANQLGITNGDWVYIETPEGRIQQKVQITSDILPGVVHAEHGWWFPEQPGEDPHLFGVWKSSCGLILPDEPTLCDYVGGPPTTALLCKVYKV